MNTKYTEQLTKVKSSSAYFNEIYVHKHFNELYNEIIAHSKIHNMDNYPFKAKIYNYEFNITDIPKCENCNNSTPIYKKYDIGYTPFCSRNCGFEFRRKQSISNSNLKDIIVYDDEYIKNHILNNSKSVNAARIKEGYIITNFPYFHAKILKYIKNNHIAINPNKDVFLQQLYYYVNNIKETIMCNECNNLTSFGDSFNDGFRPYCSPKCREKNGYTQIKREQTVIEKYGVSNVAKADTTKIKQAETNNLIYGATSSFQNVDVRQKHKDNLLASHNVKYTGQIPYVKEAIKKTHNEKYDGWYTKTDEYIEKVKKTYNEKYGVDWFTQREEWKSDMISINNDKYNTDWYSQTEEYKEKVVKTNNAKYNKDWYIQSEDFKEKFKITSNKNYGVSHPMLSPIIMDKLIQLNLTKYNKKWYYQTDDFKEKAIITNNEKYDADFYTKSKKYQDIITENNQIIYNSDDISLLDYDAPHAELLSKKCGHEYIISSNTFKRRKAGGLVICTVCNPINDNISYAEAEVLEFIKSLCIAEVSPSNRSILKGKELDIYLPSHNFAIEYNGLYWHSEIYRDSEYHLSKTIMCKDNGIELFHLWEDFWIYKKDIVKSLIREKLNLSLYIININDCSIEIIASDEAQEFFNNNHLDDISCGDINIGLLHNGKIVSMMSILSSDINEYTIIGIANILNTSIYGGINKLFDYFVNNYEYEIVIAHVDISQISFNIYEQLGFVKIDNIQPIYKLFSTNDYKRVDEYNDSYEYLKIWNCGYDIYVLA